MKNTIISKLKRLVLALFAALCVGSAMAGDRGVFWSRPPEINVSPDGLVTVKSGTANNYTWSQGDSGHDQTTYNAAVKGLTCEDRLEYTLVTTEGETITREIIVKEAYSVTNVGWHGPTLDSDYIHQIEEWGSHQVISVSVTYKAILNKSVSSTIDYNNKQNRDKFIYSGYDFEMSGVLSTSCTWDNSKNCFVVLGSAIADSVKIQYALGGMDLTTNSELVESKTVSASGNEYRIEIPYTDDRKLIWRVYAIEDGDESLYVDNSQKSVFEKIRWDNSRVTYTWQGGPEEGNWTDSFNWSTDVSEAWGYPGTKGESYYCTFVRFESDAVVDLNKGEYTLIDGGASLYFAPGINVVLKNGTLGLHSSYVIGAAGTTVEYNNMKLIYTKSSPDNHTNLSFADGSTNIFSGTINCPLNYLPVKSNTKVVFKDGEIKTEYSNSTFSNLDSHEVEINNATWLIKVNNSTTGATRGIAGVVKFRDGVDRQPLLKVESKKALMLQGTYDFVLSSDREYTHYVEAGNAYTYVKDGKATTYKCNIKVDATALVGEAKVPLMKFTAVDNYTDAIMAEMVDPANKYLKVIVDGKEVDNSKYGANLVWENDILYYQQTEPKVAAITKTETDDAGNETEVTIAEYATLGEALEAATDGATIKVLNDVEITSYLQITKSLTLNLNGKSIMRTDSTDNSTALFVNAADAIVTITGDGTVTADHAVYVNAGKVVIENGTFSAGTHAVYVINNGNAEIKGGAFSSEDGQYHYALNEYDQTRDATSIVVTGGTFVGFNPANNTAEGANTNFCADGYTAVAGEEEGTWVVQKAISELKPGVPVTNISATTEEEAISKVKLTVEVPENANVTKDDYANYFKLVATETSEGSGVWEVAAVLDDTKVTPVIAETTPAITFNEDGTVTVNIENELPGLNYGVRYATTVEAVDAAEIIPGFTVTPAEGDTAGFFKVVVDFNEIK